MFRPLTSARFCEATCVKLQPVTFEFSAQCPYWPEPPSAMPMERVPLTHTRSTAQSEQLPKEMACCAELKSGFAPLSWRLLTPIEESASPLRCAELKAAMIVN